MRSTFVSVAWIGLLSVVSGGCHGNVDPDPGVCFTTAEYDSAQVDRDYAEKICRDWVRIFLENCIEVYGLKQNPDEADVGAYCARATVTQYTSPEDNAYPNYGSDKKYTYQIQHSCNFINNQAYACNQYADEDAEKEPDLGSPASELDGAPLKALLSNQLVDKIKPSSAAIVVGKKTFAF